MKNKLSTIILAVIFLAGLSLILYPSLSDYWNSLHASKAVADYAESVRNINEDEYKKMLKEAVAYNNKEIENTSILFILDN